MNTTSPDMGKMLGPGPVPTWILREDPARCSDFELLALALGSAAAATTLLNNGQAKILSVTEDELCSAGCRRHAARRTLAVIELARRSLTAPHYERPQLNRPDLIASYFEPLVRGLEVEKFWVLCLDRKNRLLKRVEVSSGSATACLAHPREVFREAIRAMATAIVCVHNHPSGDPAPSSGDLQATRQLVDAARAVDIQLLDHVILGRPSCDPTGAGHYSFRSAGIL